MLLRQTSLLLEKTFRCLPFQKRFDESVKEIDLVDDRRVGCRRENGEARRGEWLPHVAHYTAAEQAKECNGMFERCDVSVARYHEHWCLQRLDIRFPCHRLLLERDQFPRQLRKTLRICSKFGIIFRKRHGAQHLDRHLRDSRRVYRLPSS